MGFPTFGNHGIRVEVLLATLDHALHQRDGKTENVVEVVVGRGIEPIGIDELLQDCSRIGRIAIFVVQGAKTDELRNGKELQCRERAACTCKRRIERLEAKLGEQRRSSVLFVGNGKIVGGKVAEHERVARACTHLGCDGLRGHDDTQARTLGFIENGKPFVRHRYLDVFEHAHARCHGSTHSTRSFRAGTHSGNSRELFRAPRIGATSRREGDLLEHPEQNVGIRVGHNFFELGKRIRFRTQAHQTRITFGKPVGT